MSRKVMIVDDDPSIRIAVKTLLGRAEFDVRTAGSGPECLEELRKGFKGVILMDIMMPDMDGWDTITEIVNRGYNDGNMIFMLTAKDVPDRKMDGLQEYVIDYLTKPFEPHELVGAVEQYLSYLG